MVYSNNLGMSGLSSIMSWVNQIDLSTGRTQGEGPGPPLGTLPVTRFSGPFIFIFTAYVRKIFAMWEDQTSLQHGSGIR